MFGLDSPLDKYNGAANSTRRGSLYESRVWGTHPSPPQKHYSIDLSMLNSGLDQQPFINHGLGRLDQLNAQIQGLQQLRSEYDERGSDRQKAFLMQVEDPKYRSDFPPGAFHSRGSQGANGVHTNANGPNGPNGANNALSLGTLNTNLGYSTTLGRASSDLTGLQSSASYVSPILASPSTVVGSGHQVSPTIPDSSFKYPPTQQGVVAGSLFNPNVGHQAGIGITDPHDRHFTYRPQNADTILNNAYLPPPSMNTDQFDVQQRGYGTDAPVNIDEAGHYWSGVSKNTWNQPLINENIVQTNVPNDDLYPALRRYSYGDALLPPLAGPMKSHLASSKHFNSSNTPQRYSLGSLEERINQKIYDDKAIAAVNEYFTVDTHQRVKVSTEFLSQRFFEEKKYLKELFQLPQFPLDSSVRDLQLVLVCFKAGRLDVFYMPQGKPSLIDIQEDDLVIVEADRGRDLGKVVKLGISVDEARLLKLLQFLEQLVALNEKTTDDITLASLHHGPGNGPRGAGEGAYFAPPTLYCPKPILSLALRAEILLIISKSQDEENACRMSLAKIASTLNLINAGESKGTLTLADLSQMKLIDAEYQFDRRKLIFYYSTSKRIDFRDLVRELFRIYKTRIWMCAVTGIPYLASTKKVPQKLQAKLSGDKQGSNTTDRRMSGPFANLLLGLDTSEGALFGVKPSSSVAFDDIPRNFQSSRTQLQRESLSQQASGEFLVLKSLVDTLNN